jgi:hypothetical protein
MKKVLREMEGRYEDLKTDVFWDVTPCGSVDVYRCFVGI